MTDLHPILKELLHRTKGDPLGNPGIEHALLKHGRFFVGINRPKGYRRRTPQACFFNSTVLAMEDRGTYVEGYATGTSERFLIHHAWITLDGVHAIDTTWQTATDASYFGIPFRTEILIDWSNRHRGPVIPLLNYEYPELVEKLLQDTSTAEIIADL